MTWSCRAHSEIVSRLSSKNFHAKINRHASPPLSVPLPILRSLSPAWRFWARLLQVEATSWHLPRGFSLDCSWVFCILWFLAWLGVFWVGRMLRFREERAPRREFSMHNPDCLGPAVVTWPWAFLVSSPTAQLSPGPRRGGGCQADLTPRRAPVWV